MLAADFGIDSMPLPVYEADAPVLERRHLPSQ